MNSIMKAFQTMSSTQQGKISNLARFRRRHIPLPVIRGVMERRILVNYRVAPAVLENLLPYPFSPQRHRCWGIAGICLIRLAQIRPAALPWLPGLKSENAAHRIAAVWPDEYGAEMTGVYIPRRDTSLRINAWAGGRLFPGHHHHSRFEVNETADQFKIAIRTQDAGFDFQIRARRGAGWPHDSLFASQEEASEFMRLGSCGFSPTSDNNTFEGLELRTRKWSTQPLAVEHLRSAFFDDPVRFPRGSIAFDHALLMEGIDHEWHALPSMQQLPPQTGKAHQ